MSENDHMDAQPQNETAQVPNNPQVIFSWEAPLRAYKKRAQGVLRFYIALSLILSAIVFLFGDKILILPIWAVMFLFYILTITPPPVVNNKITKFGIETSGNFFRWDFLSYFYFTKKFDYTVLVVVSVQPYYYHMYMVVPDDTTKEKLKHLLAEHLIYQEHPTKTFSDHAVDFLSKLMPDEESHSHESNHTESVPPQPIKPEVSHESNWGVSL